MNERIKEIVKQAGVFYSYQDDVWLATNGDLERFAELIVNECANRASWAQDTDAKDIGSEVLKHFGVEE